eukprot:6450572-Amphidinium_carterae.1
MWQGPAARALGFHAAPNSLDVTPRTSRQRLQILSVRQKTSLALERSGNGLLIGAALVAYQLVHRRQSLTQANQHNRDAGVVSDCVVFLGGSGRIGTWG